MATVNVDPLGAVSVTADVTVQGQGHETVLSQIVAEQLGLTPDDIDVMLEIDTAKDQWSIAAGTYSCRFTPGTAVAAHHGGGPDPRTSSRGIAAKQLNVLAGRCRIRRTARSAAGAIPTMPCPFGRVAGTAHWSPVMLPEGMAPALARDRGVDAAGTRAAVERRPHQHVADLWLRVRHVRDRDRSLTDQVRVDRYVSMHDAGSCSIR